MKNLKHLDIGQNDFGICFNDVPQIKEIPTYATQQSNVIDMENADKEISRNEILYKAMMSASSLWRKHGQSTMRNKIFNISEPLTSGVVPNTTNGPGQTSPCVIENDCIATTQTKPSSTLSPLKNDFYASSPVNAPVEYWDEDFKSIVPESKLKNDCIGTNHTKPSSSTSPLKNGFYVSSVNAPDEYWDDDFKPIVPERSVLCESSVGGDNAFLSENSCTYGGDNTYWSDDSESDCNLPDNFSKVYHETTYNLPPTINMHFIPTDLHVKPIEMPKALRCTEDGQFDDVES